VDRRVGVVEIVRAGRITMVQGRLDIGRAMATPLIRAVKRRLGKETHAILDAPPGASCPVVTTLRGADYVLLVTEPTPFGLHDLKIAVDVVRLLKIPFGVVINRSGIGDDRVRTFCESESVPVLVEIPDDRRIAEAYSKGELIVDALPEYRGLFTGLLGEIMTRGSRDRQEAAGQ
jgi:MinD superfamily P-loop ATPase